MERHFVVKAVTRYVVEEDVLNDSGSGGVFDHGVYDSYGSANVIAEALYRWADSKALRDDSVSIKLYQRK